MRPSSLGEGRILRRTLSVCPSVPCLLTLEHRSRVFVNLADVRYLLFTFQGRISYGDQPHKLVILYYFCAFYVFCLLVVLVRLSVPVQ